MSLLDRVDVVLVEPSEGGNVGACCRALMNCGFEGLTLVRPQVRDWTEAEKLAVHAGDMLARARAEANTSLRQAISEASWVVGVSGRARKHPERRPPLDPGRFVERMWAQPVSGRTALLFGAERTGLTNEQLGLCQDLLYLPTDDRYPSMNLAQAVMVVAWTIRMSDLAGQADHGLSRLDPKPLPKEQEPRQAVSAAEVDGLVEHARFTLTNIDYLDPQNPRLILDELRKVFSRAELDVRELRMLRGIFHRMDLFVTRHGGPATPNQPRGPKGR